MDAQTNTTSSLADHGTSFQGVIDTFNRVVLHANKKTRTELWVGCTSIEKCGRRVREVSFRHQIVRFQYALDIITVNADSDSHDHVLRALCNTTTESE